MDDPMCPSKDSSVPSKTANWISKPSSSDFLPENCITDLPVVIRWTNNRSAHFIGADHHQLRMNIQLGTDKNPELLFWFSISVSVSANPKSSHTRTKSLYFVVKGSLIDRDTDDNCLSLDYSQSKYCFDTYASIRNAGIMTDESSLCCTLFKLHDHGTVFMPPYQNCPFTPISDNALDLLKEIQSLSQAKRFRVFISSEGVALSSFWKTIDKRCRGTFTDDFTTQKSVYKKGMVCDEWKNFNPFVKQKNSAIHQNTLHNKKHNSESLPLYTKGYQSTGMKRKDSDRLNDSHGVCSENDELDQRFIGTESEEEVETERPGKYTKISSGKMPSGVHNTVTGPNHKSNKSYADRQNPQVQFAEPCSEVLNPLEESYLEKQLAAFICWILEFDSHLEKACEQVFLDLGEAVTCGDRIEFNKIKSKCMAEIYCKYTKRGSEWVLKDTRT
ncbi:uncharacterized protein EAE98_004521 [Botrytis deweyae]|uniref:Uncharacterized protein n=1 Tax=Botrytis deweyae TaxID=2478750 RepID=A0ABQ7IR47_9HELO|nr:uncharacterized protein EAE98_004521 [Botrytis deweyae]KAF7931785.1 hypothetical protein EAE98_004521 [Botrytis deweyae]